MESEVIIVKTNTREYKAFFQAGFFPAANHGKKLHKHNYPEVHVIANGEADFYVNERLYKLTSGSMIVIPRGAFHYFELKDGEMLHSAFQIDSEMNEVSIYNIGTDTVLNFFDETEKCRFSGDYSGVAAYIALFCNYFCRKKKLVAHPADDYGFIIYEFFSNHYSDDVRLNDLAKLLHLSERQTERLVLDYTGNNFKKELAVTRINIAENLLKYSNMSMQEVAEYVGYKSYVGFWKAMKKYSV